MRHILSIVILYLFQINILQGQIKFEKEKRIKEKDVPEAALNFIKDSNIDKAMKWYQEINQSGTSFEAKGIYMHSKHSIEFNKSGHIEDVEIEVERKQLPIKTLASIENYLSREYEAFKLKKIQKQWTGKAEFLKASIKSGQKHPDIQLNYECVAFIKSDGEYRSYEFLFSANGDYKSAFKIIEDSRTNIEF